MNLFEHTFNLDEHTSSNHAHHEQHRAFDANLSTLIIQMTNCRLVRGNALVVDDLWIRNGIILDPHRVFYEERRVADLQIDCDQLILAPGFIDVQLNGGFGRDFTNDAAPHHDIAETLEFVSQRVLAHGVTAYCPTIISSDPANYRSLLTSIDRWCSNSSAAAASATPATATAGPRSDANTAASSPAAAIVLGVHLEGPFISKDKMGAHDQHMLQTFAAASSAADSIAKLHEVYGGLDLDTLRRTVRIVTLAPELDADGVVVDYLTRAGIVVSIGHSAANLAQGERAAAQGARFITHLFNAMLPFHHRDPHLIGLLSSDSLVRPGARDEQRIYYGVIADGVHTHPSAINISYRAHPHGLVLVTDAMAAMGLDDGQVHNLGNREVEIVREPAHNNGSSVANDGPRVRTAYLKGTRTLCGSVASMDECVRQLVRATQCTLVEALRCASEHPAKLLGMYPRKGSLEYGADADFVVLDDALTVKATFLRGDMAWTRADWSPLFRCKFIPGHRSAASTVGGAAATVAANKPATGAAANTAI